MTDNMKKTIAIRRATTDDSERIAELLWEIASLHHDNRPDMFGCGSKFSAEQVVKLISEGAAIFVAEDGGRVAGYVFCEIQKREAWGIKLPYTALWIEDLCVDASARGQGIASALMDRAMEYGREIGCDRMELNVWDFDGSAVGFYEKLGMNTQRRIMEKRI